MLVPVVRWNGASCRERYAELLRIAGDVDERGRAEPGEQLATRLAALARAGELPATLRDIGVPRQDLAGLAEDAAKEWTGAFNPRPFDAAAALQLYERAY
jgi:alcohol dehydrogenase class IV